MSKQILLLQIYNDTPDYNQMMNMHRRYIHMYSNIDSYFVTFNEQQDEDIKLVDNDIISVKGCESFANILLKTVKALNYVMNDLNKTKHYDFIVRSNVSTVINLKNLQKYLETIPTEKIYTGSYLEKIGWTLAPHEMRADMEGKGGEFMGQKYMSGHGIILSKDIAHELIAMDKRGEIDYNIVDDVLLGKLIRQYYPNVYETFEKIPMPNTIIYMGHNSPFDDINTNEADMCVFFRNRSQLRVIDLVRINCIIQRMLNPNLIIIGNSDTPIKIINVSKRFRNVIYVINKTNWATNDAYSDEFYIVVRDGVCTCQRIDSDSNVGWGMQLMIQAASISV